VPTSPEPTAAAVSVVIVTYQSARDLAMCLGSLDKAAGSHPLEVVVVDNASSDASVEIARGYGVKVIEQHSNQGLSRAIGVGVAATAAPWLLIANPDTWLSPGSLARLMATATSDQRIGCVGPHLANPDGSDYPTGRRFPSLAMGAAHAALAPIWPDNPATRRYHMAGSDRSRPAQVDWVSGACMLVRRAAYEQVGGFDPGYFMYFEEMDFCLRLHRAGWRVLLDPLAEVKHVVGGSTRSAPYRKVIYHHRSAMRFYRRRYAGDPRLALAPLVAAFLLLRGAASLARTALARRRERRSAPP
jgi:N-acetylglucosaminyl-diphospho-decaprenol L-rhamnosyltransferase